MGGLGPGIGGGEWLVIGVVALLVVGPERLPGLLRELGKWVAKARGMANEFRASFDDMARQSELDDLRKEVEALRSGNPVRLGADAEAAFADIKSEFDRPLFDATAPNVPTTAEPVAEPVMTPAPTEWPVDTGMVVDTSEPAPAKPRAKRASSAKSVAKPAAKSAAKAASRAPAKPAAKPRVSRKKAVDL